MLLVALLPALQPAFEAAFTIVVFAMLGIGLAWLWHRWPAIPHGLDMGFGMLTLGNLGMLLGWWADLGFGPVRCARCCSVRGPAGAPRHDARHAAVRQRGHARLGRRPGPHSWAMLAGGNAGMVVGMFVGGRLAEGVRSRTCRWRRR